MKAKQIFFIMAAVVLSLTGCGKQEKEEGNTVTEYFKHRTSNRSKRRKNYSNSNKS